MDQKRRDGPTARLPEAAEIEVMMAPKVLARRRDVRVNHLNGTFLLPGHLLRRVAEKTSEIS